MIKNAINSLYFISGFFALIWALGGRPSPVVVHGVVIAIVLVVTAGCLFLILTEGKR